MKRFFLAAIVLLSAVTMNAQQQRREFNPENQATRQATQIKEACNVTDEQYTALYNLLLSEAQKMRAQMDSLRAAGAQGGMRQFNREEWKKRQDEQTAKIKAILTPEQHEAYDKYLKEQQERRNRMGGGPRRQQQ